MKHYELLVILPGTMTEDEVTVSMEKIKIILTENGASETSFQNVGKNRLAYPIKHIRYGYFYLGHFQAEPQSMIEIQKRLRLLDEPLRALIQFYDPTKQNLKKIESLSAIESIEIVPREMQSRENRFEKKERMVVAAPMTKEEEVKEPEVKAEQEEKSTPVATPAVPAVDTTTMPTAVSMEEIDKKLEEILSKDIEV